MCISLISRGAIIRLVVRGAPCLVPSQGRKDFVETLDPSLPQMCFHKLHGSLRDCGCTHRNRLPQIIKQTDEFLDLFAIPLLQSQPIALVHRRF